MKDNLLQLFIPVICLSVNVFFQILSINLFLKAKLLKSIYSGFMVGLVSLFLLYCLVSQLAAFIDINFMAIALVNLMAYILLSYCYFHFINLGQTSRRIRILRELYEARDGLSLDELLLRYNAQEILERRLKRLLGNKQISYRNGKYYIGSPLMLFITKIIILMKLVLLGKKSEFEKP